MASLHSLASSSTSFKSRRGLAFALLLLVLLGLFLWKPPFVVRPLSSNNTEGAGNSPSAPAANAASAFINPIWDSKIIPAFLNRAIDATELVPAVQKDPDKAGEKYGRREATNPYNYLIKGVGQVTSVNTESRAGTLTLGLADAAPGQNVTIQIGPVVVGTAIRDATGIVSFNQFTNQIDYAGVSKEMNARALREALAGRDPASFKGKQIRFVGAFAYDSHATGVIRITPVKLEVKN